MRKIIFLVGLVIVGFSISFMLKKNSTQANVDLFQDGDIIFQTSKSSQSKAIQLATHSQYSHCGLVYKKNNRWYVFEAVQPVKSTELSAWIKRGENQSYRLKRLKNSHIILTHKVLQNMKEFSKKQEGKNYDLAFEWSDERMYCSELVWEIYKNSTGLEIGHLQKLKEFDLSHDAVKQKMIERYGNKIPLNEYVISPVSIFNSDLLIEVN